MRILIVDDQKTNREMFRYMLTSIAEDITLFENGEGVVDALKEAEALPDVILMDVMMPVKDGFTTAKEIRAEFPNVHMPIIFLTVLDDRDSFGRCLFYGDDFILKPVGRSTLLAKVQAHYRIAKMHNEVSKQRDELSKFREQVKYDYAISESIFTNLAEDMYKNIDGIEYISNPSTVFNGDLIVVANRPQGGVYVMIADATGHGLPAAISTIPATRAFFSMAAKGMSLGEILEEINTALVRFLPLGMMVAANVFEISANGVDVTWWGGGLPDSYILDSEGKIINNLTSAHMPLGVLSAEEFETNMVHLRMEQGQQIVCYTDGVTEAANPTGEQFGEDRLKDVLNACEPNAIIPSLYEAVNVFSHKSKDDDLSILTMTFPIHNEAGQTPDAELPFVGRVPLNTRLSFPKDVLSGVTVMAEVRHYISGIVSGGPNLDLVCSVLSELFANAIEHGLLGLDSKLKSDEEGFFTYYQLREERLQDLSDDAVLTLDLEYLPEINQLAMTIEHTGEGFNYHELNMVSDENSYGRGIVLVSELCESLEYSNCGKRVKAVYQFTEN
ncbi:putative Serine phosphatase RsbU, regulator of sigma subunit fused with Signal receiver domain [Vibrio nigripulchritudo SFn27]|uniref:Putative Serine phosphatase RsbU, regulator of sigma subunit fused with Signal receiver domain n=1 Tax=Vibrio nigripulchritudo TaxID=28173 RepID=U4KFX8_9VIBR|nr:MULTISPECIES: SpoIIE family protein phosphatase [Vibrio]UAB73280.1 SpoIIE family protein phosphatase [Vibrio sp. SCSIO 43132]CCN83906.1 putative Serine phosphatase RsbU, regulator of sigma subunit fused with Signal receiver domain [Vibrio nigripulchritudo BLFn1]CCN89424.1 putative Serine phosphatase RsbU, regulator of sigma subunit fused with Signal receiver domain [Vibrio nigripulchritudo SFn27]CCN92921.1 putative Serine phosphatase RsbU, regulator of sigma subunit fused with Signal receive